MAGQSAPPGPMRTVAQGTAVALMVLPEAMPMRLRPKSKPRATRPRPSGMARGEAHARAVDAQQLPGSLPAILEGKVEDDLFAHRQAQPGIVEHFALEL